MGPKGSARVIPLFLHNLVATDTGELETLRSTLDEEKRLRKQVREGREEGKGSEGRREAEGEGEGEGVWCTPCVKLTKGLVSQIGGVVCVVWLVVVWFVVVWCREWSRRRGGRGGGGLSSTRVVSLLLTGGGERG